MRLGGHDGIGARDGVTEKLAPVAIVDIISAHVVMILLLIALSKLLG